MAKRTNNAGQAPVKPGEAVPPLDYGALEAAEEEPPAPARRLWSRPPKRIWEWISAPLSCASAPAYL